MMVIIINRRDQRKLYVINIYRPPSGNPDVALDYITDIVKKIKLDTSRHTIVLLGDFNIDCSKNKQQTRQFSLLNNFSLNYDLHQFIDRPTHFGSISSSTIDLMLTDSKYVSFHGTIAYYVSDHIPTFLVLKKHKDLCPLNHKHNHPIIQPQRP